MNNELKVSFYLKRGGSTEKTEVNPDAIYPIVGKIIIGNSSDNNDKRKGSRCHSDTGGKSDKSEK